MKALPAGDGIHVWVRARECRHVYCTVPVAATVVWLSPGGGDVRSEDVCPAHAQLLGRLRGVAVVELDALPDQVTLTRMMRQARMQWDRERQAQAARARQQNVTMHWQGNAASFTSTSTTGWTWQRGGYW